MEKPGAPIQSSSRYSRQILFEPIGRNGQKRLAEARVVVVGCGALGAAQADLLARAGVGHLRLIDRDYVEASNLQRQTLFDEVDAAAGLPKAIAAQQRLGRVNSSVTIEPVVSDLTPANAEELLDGATLILDGTDNAETRYLINDFAVARGVPWVYGAAVAARGMTFTVLPGETACLACIFPDMAQATTETCDTSGVLSWAVSWVAALQASEAVKWLVGDAGALRRTLISGDLWRNEYHEMVPRRDEQCRACGQRDFIHLRGEGRAAVTLCGRDAVQIHERRQALDLTVLGERLRGVGEVRGNAWAVRFVPAAPAGLEMTIFPDGRALIKGTTDAGLARSLYARYVGS